MYNVLVVDDENLICLGIKSMIERLGLPEIGTVSLAENAQEADESMRSSRPDIVITDIQMPGLNGLEMIKSMMHGSGSMKFIILSGFDEFKYAKEAMKMGVMDYLLKPASIEELKNVLENAISALNLEKQNPGAGNELKYRQLMMENNLRKLFLLKSPDEFDLRNTLDRLQPLFPYPCFTLGIMGQTLPERRDIGGESAVVPFDNRTNAGPSWLAACLLSSENEEIIVINHTNDLPRDEILSVAAISTGSKTCSGRGEVMALSETGSGIECLVPLYKQAKKAFAYRLLLGDAHVIRFQDIMDRPQDAAAVEGEIGEFRELVKTPREDRISNFIDSHFSDASLVNRSIDSVYRLYAGIARQLDGLSAEGRNGGGEEPLREAQSFSTIRDIRIYLKEAARLAIKALREEETEKTVVASTMNYVRENFSRDISLAVVANRASVSYTHFSRLFKLHTGMNFSEFLMKVRMEQAKKLLEDPKLRIYEISGKVGYDDPKHFTRAFRQYYGMSPMEYRTGAISSGTSDN